MLAIRYIVNLYRCNMKALSFLLQGTNEIVVKTWFFYISFCSVKMKLDWLWIFPLWNVFFFIVVYLLGAQCTKFCMILVSHCYKLMPLYIMHLNCRVLPMSWICLWILYQYVLKWIGQCTCISWGLVFHTRNLFSFMTCWLFKFLLHFS